MYTLTNLRVSATTNSASVAGAIAGIIREGRFVEVQSVGAGALNQSVKAIAIARGYLAPSGIGLSCVPSFVDIDINGEQKTAIRIKVERDG